MAWAALAGTVPIYPLYALLFEDAGLSSTQISTLFVLWSTMGIVAEVPSGALADRFSRRALLGTGEVLQALAYGLWIVVPGYPAFAAGFVLWGLGSAFTSGALEALLYDGLTAAGAKDFYPRLYGRVAATGLVAQVPVALAATVLFATGGYDLVGWASVGTCLASAATAARLPEATRGRVKTGEGRSRYLATLRTGLSEAAGRPPVRAAVVAVALLGGLDGLEEYFALLAEDWGVRTSAVPLALLGVPVAGALGAAAGGRAAGLRPGRLAAVLGAAVGVFGVAALWRRPAGLAAVAAAYFLYQLVVVVVDARLQAGIRGSARATVTSVASLGTDLTGMVLYAAWAVGQPLMVMAMAVTIALSLPRLLRTVNLDAVG